MTKTEIKPLANGLSLEVRKDSYLGLWNVWYTIGGKWAGPFRTKREAVEAMESAE